MTTIKNNCKQIIRIAKMELSTMFYSPIAWLLLVIFAFQVGSIFAGKLDDSLRAIDMDRGLFALSTIFFTGIGSVFAEVVKNIYLYIPLLTMGLMSREYSSGSIKLLYSSPIKDSSIVFGKFFAMVVYGFVLMAVAFIYVGFSGIVIANFEWGMVMTGMLGIFLLLCAYSAIGLFMSSLTSYQVVAAIGTLALLSVLNYVKEVGQNIEFVKQVTYWLSLSGRVDVFIKGLISSEGVIYFLTVIVLFILLTIFRINGERENISRRSNVIRYSLLILGTVCIGYFSTQPRLKFFYDATYSKGNTLAVESQEIIKMLKGPLKITTYVNLLDKDYFLGIPRNQNSDLKKFEQYLRFKPEIEFKYVYYYHKTHNPKLYTKYPNMSDREIAETICKIQELNFKDFLSPEEIEKIIDLSAEDYRFIRVAERKNEKGELVTTLLRNFNDNMIHPKEEEISAALRRLADKMPVVAFIAGHGDRGITNTGGRGYSLFSTDVLLRNSLVNKGFDIVEFDLSKENIPAEINIVVIPDLKTSLSEVELNRYKSYVERGGNLFILCDNGRQQNMNPLLEPFKINFLDGVLVRPTQTQIATIIPSKFTAEAVDNFPQYNSPRKYNYRVSMPTAVAIDYSSVEGYDLIPILTTDSIGCWIERETTDFVDHNPELNSEQGEVEGVYSTCIMLKRNINNQEQRIVVSGDADCVSNEEFIVKREYQKANFTLSSNVFRWLSGDKFPVFTDRKPKIDREMNLPKNIRPEAKILSTGLVAALILIGGVIFIVRRKRK